MRLILLLLTVSSAFSLGNVFGTVGNFFSNLVTSKPKLPEPSQNIKEQISNQVLFFNKPLVNVSLAG